MSLPLDLKLSLSGFVSALIFSITIIFFNTSEELFRKSLFFFFLVNYKYLTNQTLNIQILSCMF